MIDGKTICALTDTSTQSCYICGAKPTQMNNLALTKSWEVEEENLKYGLSVLHAWIKFLECILHISYKLGYKKPSVRGATVEQKEEIEKRKKDVQENLWKNLGIKVDRVVQGKGTSNTGNVARRFFANPAKAAKATGVSEELIKRFGTILQV